MFDLLVKKGTFLIDEKDDDNNQICDHRVLNLRPRYSLFSGKERTSKDEVTNPHNKSCINEVLLFYN
jgi:hypothetical protein